MADDVIDFRLPSLGSDMEEGTILQWNVAVGDNVHKGDAVLAVETEKGDIDVETWDDGVVAEICTAVGETVPVGTVIARISTAVAAPASSPPSSEPSAEVEPPPAPSEPATADAGEHAPTPPTITPPVPPAGPAPSERSLLGAGPIPVSPRVVYWPAEAVSTRDRGSERPLASTVVGDFAAIDDPMRRAVARTMDRANREIPHYHLTHEIDLAVAQRWLLAHNESVDVADRIVMAALFTKATAVAARAVPELNGHWGPGGLEPADDVNLAMIIRRRGGGIVAPVIHDVDERSVVDTMAALTDVATRAKRDELRASDLTDATMSITNLGDRGVRSVLGIIQPPQVGLVGFGRPEDRPVAVDGAVVVHPTVVASLAGDHRATDGQTGARFLRALDNALQEPDAL